MPGIGGGAQALDISLAMARIALADSIHTIACTRHINPGLYMSDSPGIRNAIAAQQTAA